MINCSIYVSGLVSEENLKSGFSSFLNAEVNEISCVDKGDYKLYIEENGDFDEYRQRDFPDGFLYFRYLIYLEFKNETVEALYVDETTRILNWLWSQNLAAVAACDYEALLPENGGYKSQNVPWID